MSVLCFSLVAQCLGGGALRMPLCFCVRCLLSSRPSWGVSCVYSLLRVMYSCHQVPVEKAEQTSIHYYRHGLLQ